MITRMDSNVVTSVLESYKAQSLKEFSISLYPYTLTRSQVTRWLEFVFSRRVERLNLSSGRVSIENAPKLVTMVFFFCEYSGTMHDFTSVAAHLETLTIYLYFPESKALSIPEMPRLKKLTLLFFDTKPGVKLPITSWIRAAPRLQEFYVKTPDYLARRQGRFKVPKAEKFPHLHLKVFEFSGFFYCAEDHRGFVRYIMKNCVELRRMKIVTLFSHVCERGLCTGEKRDAWLMLKHLTEKLVALKVPDRLQVLVV